MSKPPNMLSAIEPWDLVANGYAETTMQMLAHYADEAIAASKLKPGAANLSFQHECNLIQVKISETGLSIRGAKVTLHDHFDGTRALRWKNRKYTYTAPTKAQRKTMAKQSMRG